MASEKLGLCFTSTDLHSSQSGAGAQTEVAGLKTSSSENISYTTALATKSVVTEPLKPNEQP